MLSERITRALEKKTPKSINFGTLGFIISILIVNAISTDFLVTAVRSTIAAPQILPKLIPVLGGLILIPFCVAIMTLFFNGTFLALVGGFLQAFSRVLLLIPSDTQLVIYYFGMIGIMFGHALVLLGMLGMLLKDIKINGTSNGKDINTTVTVMGMLLGFSFNIVIRMPGIQLAENVLINASLSGLLVVFILFWYNSIDKKHNIIKNVDDVAGFKQGKEKKFRKTLYLSLLGPSFALFGFTFNRYEWLAATSSMPYSSIGYIIFLSIMIAPIIERLASRIEKGKDIILITLLTVATVGVGLSQAINVPWLVMIGIIVSPTALYMTMLQNIKLTRQELTNNVDITIIFTWLIAIGSTCTLAVISLVIFFPYVTLIAFSPVLAQEIIRVVKTNRRTDG